ncbi:MAG: hypothetical protein JEZ04_08165 [Spirochaetales bacterium]|nr:hypothetical protein [Spirochaetales bacterium]
MKRNTEIEADGESLFISTNRTIDDGSRVVDCRPVGDEGDAGNGSLSVSPAGDDVLLLAPEQLKSPELTAK